MATGVSAATVCKAHQKLNPFALWGLNERLLWAFAQACPLSRWHCLRVGGAAVAAAWLGWRWLPVLVDRPRLALGLGLVS